jgi:hypothetical protein
MCPSFFMETSPSFFRRFRANVTAGLVTESQMGKRGRNHGLPLSLCLRDGLQIVFF